MCIADPCPETGASALTFHRNCQYTLYGMHVYEWKQITIFD